MWFFSKDPSSTFSYTKTGEEYDPIDGWNISNCKNKKGEDLTMFIYNKSNDSNLSNIQNGVKRMKTLKHPDILSYVDSTENTKQICLVTENVEPLSEYFRKRIDKNGGNLNFITSWGLLEIVRALQFLQERCELCHGNLNLNAVFVTVGGDWKLGLLDKVNKDNGQKTDSLGLGRLIWEIFNHRLSHDTKLDSNSGNIPQPLVKLWQRLINSKSRLSMSSVMKQLQGGFCDNFYVETMLFVEELHVKTAQERSGFLSQLPKTMDNLPFDCVRHKLIPILIQLIQQELSATSTSSDPSYLIPSLAYIAEKVQNTSNTDTTIASELGPSLVQLFQCHHRRTRVLLMQNMVIFGSLLPPDSIDTHILTAILSALTDTNATVREISLRGSVSLAPLLSKKNLENSLIRTLLMIQSKDEQGGIRANAVVCLIKIAHQLISSSSTISTSTTNIISLIVNGLLRATRDTFAPTRRSTISAISSLITATPSVISLNELATKILPCICFLTVDPDPDVRQTVFTTFTSALQRLENNIDETVTSTSSNVDSGNIATASQKSSSKSSWLREAATSNITWLSNKFISSSVPAATGGAATPVMSSPSTSNTVSNKLSPDTQADPTPNIATLQNHKNDVNETSWDDEGWNDDDWMVDRNDGSKQQNEQHKKKSMDLLSKHEDTNITVYDNDDPDAFFDQFLNESGGRRTGGKLKLNMTSGNKMICKTNDKDTSNRSASKDNGWDCDDW